MPGATTTTKPAPAAAGATAPAATAPAATTVLAAAPLAPETTATGATAPAVDPKAAAAGAAATTSTTTEPKPGDAAGDKAKATESAPAEIELKLPDGVEADAGLIDRFKPLAKELGLKSEGAQKLVDLFLEAQTGAVEKSRAAHEAQVQEWGKALKSDKEFGGSKFDASKAAAERAVTRFATKELRTLLEQSGLGNHPEMVRLMVRVGQAMAEDGTVVRTPAGGGESDERSFHQALYPSMFTKEQPGGE